MEGPRSRSPAQRRSRLPVPTLSGENYSAEVARACRSLIAGSDNTVTGIALQSVDSTTCRAFGFGVTLKWQVKSLPVFAHPSDLPRGYTNHQGISRHITIHDSTGSDERIFTDRIATHDSAVRTHGCAALDQSISILILARHSAAWVIHIGKHHARAAEHIIFQCHIVIHRNIVLNLDVIPNDNLVANEHVLSQRASAANDRLTTNMHPMPDTGALTNTGTFIDNCSRMDNVIFHKLS